MANFSEFITRLFQKQKNSTSKVPFLHEPIDLKNYPIANILGWHRDGEWSRYQSVLSKAFSNKLISGNLLNNEVAILESSHANGWLIRCSRIKGFNDVSYKHLAYYLHTVVKEQGYSTNLAEVKSQQRGESLETLVKYYLKPSLKKRFNQHRTSKLANQLYGNVTIEYKSIGGLPFEFKFLVNAYQDHKFLPPHDFDQLMDVILK